MTKRKDDLEQEFGKEFIDCILGKCEANCIYCKKENENAWTLRKTNEEKETSKEKEVIPNSKKTKRFR